MGNCFRTVRLQQNLQEKHYQQIKKNKITEFLCNQAKRENCETLQTIAPMQGSVKDSKAVDPKEVKDIHQNSGSNNVDNFRYEEMRLATKNFLPEYILGEGGFGIVYKGVIDENIRHGYRNTEVAIKELNRDGLQGDREWLTEVTYLGQLSHPNLVKLIGFCCEDEHRLLVYEYMPNGSLEKHLFCRVGCTLSWSRRIKIALDAAKGLAFLHGNTRSIIYRDLKTSNILLDVEFNGKLSDFGLAKDGPTGDQTHVSTRVMGTYGYAAPEYVMTGHLTARSDVYGFGVLLLELLLGRRAMDKSRPSREHNLVEWARPLLNHNKKLLRIIDPKMDGQYSSKVLMDVAFMGYQCLSPTPKVRPLMKEVVEMLENLQTEEEMKGGSAVICEVNVVTNNQAPSSSPNDSSHQTRSTPKEERKGGSAVICEANVVTNNQAPSSSPNDSSQTRSSPSRSDREDGQSRKQETAPKQEHDPL